MPDFPNYITLLHPGAGLDMEPEPRVNRTPMEDGMVKQSITASRVLVERPFMAHINSKANFNAFLTWYYDTIERAGWFNWIDPRDNVLKQARFVGGKVRMRSIRKDMERYLLEFTIETFNT